MQTAQAKLAWTILLFLAHFSLFHIPATPIKTPRLWAKAPAGQQPWGSLPSLGPSQKHSHLAGWFLPSHQTSLALTWGTALCHTPDINADTQGQAHTQLHTRVKALLAEAWHFWETTAI